MLVFGASRAAWGCGEQGVGDRRPGRDEPVPAAFVGAFGDGEQPQRSGVLLGGRAWWLRGHWAGVLPVKAPVWCSGTRRGRPTPGPDGTWMARPRS
jgi:hypothetical protein